MVRSFMGSFFHAGPMHLPLSAAAIVTEEVPFAATLARDREVHRHTRRTCVRLRSECAAIKGY